MEYERNRKSIGNRIPSIGSTYEIDTHKMNSLHRTTSLNHKNKCSLIITKELTIYCYFVNIEADKDAKKKCNKCLHNNDIEHRMYYSKSVWPQELPIPTFVHKYRRLLT